MRYSPSPWETKRVPENGAVFTMLLSATSIPHPAEQNWALNSTWVAFVAVAEIGMSLSWMQLPSTGLIRVTVGVGQELVGGGDGGLIALTLRWRQALASRGSTTQACATYERSWARTFPATRRLAW